MSLKSSLQAPNSEELEQVRSLNRLFLGFLRERARGEQDCLGLPAEALPALRAANDEQLDGVAQFPRALFTLSLERKPETMAAALADPARYAVDITLLLCAWNFSRHHMCQARFLLGLDSGTIQRLRSLPLAELALCARSPQLATCAFADHGWLWCELFAIRHAEDRRRLALLALQPGISSVTALPAARA